MGDLTPKRRPHESPWTKDPDPTYPLSNNNPGTLARAIEEGRKLVNDGSSPAQLARLIIGTWDLTGTDIRDNIAMVVKAIKVDYPSPERWASLIIEEIAYQRGG